MQEGRGSWRLCEWGEVIGNKAELKWIKPGSGLVAHAAVEASRVPHMMTAIRFSTCLAAPHFGTNLTSEVQLKTVNQNNSLWYRTLLEKASRSWYFRSRALLARQLPRQLQGHAGLCAALGLVQAQAAQASSVRIALIMSTNHTIIPASVLSALPLLCISDHPSLAGFFLWVFLLAYSPIARQGCLCCLGAEMHVWVGI